jgi:hypothetical protein
MERFHAQAIPSIASVDPIRSAVPAISALSSAGASFLADAAILALAALFFRHATQWWMRITAVALGVLGIMPAEVHTLGEFALQIPLALFWMAVAAVIAWVFARRNYLAYAAILWALPLAILAATLHGTGNAALQLQGWIVVLAAIAPIAWLLVPARSLAE